MEALAWSSGFQTLTHGEIPMLLNQKFWCFVRACFWAKSQVVGLKTLNRFKCLRWGFNCKSSNVSTWIWFLKWIELVKCGTGSSYHCDLKSSQRTPLKRSFPLQWFHEIRWFFHWFGSAIQAVPAIRTCVLLQNFCYKAPLRASLVSSVCHPVMLAIWCLPSFERGTWLPRCSHKRFNSGLRLFQFKLAHHTITFK